MRLICDEGEFETLLADLALHRLDVVLDRPRRAGRRQPEGIQHPARRIRHRPVRHARLGRTLPCRFPQRPRQRPAAPAHPPQRPAWPHRPLAGTHRNPAEDRRPNSRTAPCSPPSAAAAWAFSRLRLSSPSRSPSNSMPSRWAPCTGSASRSTPSPASAASATRL